MADVIQLLPDTIANQIAAGEVIQRPASVVKELLENAVDAGASEIRLIVKDAGKTLIQVVDNGCGMSETDARMCFERHATSKIRRAKDLFAIRTMGFRGEALASIAAIAHVEMRTRRQVDELGTRIQIEGGEVQSQEPCQCSVGTNFSVKNLFYNVPARRNFLRSDSVEMRHIIDEFQRVALAHSDIFFSLHHNDTDVYHLPAGNLRQRVIGILGSNAQKKLIPVREETDILRINGYIGRPEFAKKTRGDQFFFVNNRFIKSSYLNHSVITAYEELLPKDTHPLYVIFLDLDPARIDINVHPTKQEIKFDDERMIYNYLKVAIRHALGQYILTPTLDFEQDKTFIPSNFRSTPSTPSNQGASETLRSKASAPLAPSSPSSSLNERNLKNWEKLYEGLTNEEPEERPEEAESMTISSKWSSASAIDDAKGSFSEQQRPPYQIHGRYIVSHIKSGFLLIDQQSAHERILYEHFLDLLKDQQPASQAVLFPIAIDLNPADAVILQEITPVLQQVGFDIRTDDRGAMTIHGTPAGVDRSTNPGEMLDDLIERYKNNRELEMTLMEKVARSLATSSAIRRGKLLDEAEMRAIIDQLFACGQPYLSPTGQKCFITNTLDDLKKQFE